MHPQIIRRPYLHTLLTNTNTTTLPANTVYKATTSPLNNTDAGQITKYKCLLITSAKSMSNIFGSLTD